ncbi:MAG: hypothetical protein EOO07_32215 [Chitinophagaceae bacterium]|nr:MAG: hypothetical protein EOO07_32215 [Chitinophagaceae bacterium]
MINKGLSYLGMGFLYLVSLLPFWVLYLIADLLFVILYRITGYRRKVVQENLRNAFPEKSEQERCDIEKKYFSYLADLIVETIKGLTISRKTLLKHMSYKNPELIEEYFSRGKSIVFALGHYGNWELGTLALGLSISAKTMVIYKPITNKVMVKSVENQLMP